MSLIKIFLIQISVVFILFFGSDFVYTNYFRAHSSSLESVYRIQNNIYHHSLLPSFDGIGDWGGAPYRVCTDANGFKSDCENVFTSRNNFDIAFIGDSFTEAIGVPYEDSFVGLFANTYKKIKVANLGVGSYSPTIYRTKIEDFIKRGYKFNHLIVFIDISDIQDEATYFRDSDGNVLQGSDCTLSKRSVLTRIKVYVIDNFSLFWHGYRSIKQILIGTKRVSDKDELVLEKSDNDVLPFTLEERSEWTYSTSSSAYCELGVHGSIEKAILEMTLLHELLESNGVKLSIGVYPWPAQLLEMAMNNSDTNLQVDIWREFCTNRCDYFINMFPRYFDMIKNSSIEDVYNRYFIQGDVHYNREGNRLIHEALLELNIFE